MSLNPALDEKIGRLEEAERLLFALRKLLDVEFPEMLDNAPRQMSGRLSVVVSTKLDSYYAARARNERAAR